MTTTGLTADPRDAELAYQKTIIAELNKENEKLAALVVELIGMIDTLLEPGQPERAH